MTDKTRTSSRGVDASADALQIELVERGSTIVLKVSGMAAVEVAGQLSRALQEAAVKKPALLAVDLSGLSFISSMGLGGLVAAHVTCNKTGTTMCLINPKRFIREILNLTKLSNLLVVRDTLDEAEQLVQRG